MKAVLIDAYDSFVHILSQYLQEIDINTTIIRKDEVDMKSLALHSPDFVLLGPGPGHPSDAGYDDILKGFGNNIPILGVCLGHQAIGAAFGAKIMVADNLMHGKTCLVDHDQTGCFYGIEKPLKVVRYHSLIVSDQHLPNCLKITSRARNDGYIMGLRHTHLPIESFQFHPESVATHEGHKLLQNFIRSYVPPMRWNEGVADENSSVLQPASTLTHSKYSVFR